MELSKNAIAVLEKRYLKKDETPEDMFVRVSDYIALGGRTEDGEIDYVSNQFYELMTSMKFLPNSPTLMNAGRNLGQLAACFVLPIEDSMNGIFDTLKHAALIHKSGGGTGFSFNNLRPKNSIVGTTGGIASGPVSFMKVYNAATEQVKQGGTRRGANMAILRVDHPDILEFIDCKNGNEDLNNFNISVAITDKFMEAVRNDKWYDLVDPSGKNNGLQLKAKEVYDNIIEHAWENGDPGVIFIDEMNRYNPIPDQGDFEATNPCGEVCLLPYEACNLGSINLAKFVIIEDEIPIVDIDSLKKTVKLSVQFLDNTISMSKYPLPEITEMVLKNRKIGLGVMGFADMLYQLEVPYNSEIALGYARSIMSAISSTANKKSYELSQTRGECARENMRNATTTTIAPTGTLSIIADCSSGIEPLFALSFTRTVMDNDKLLENNPYFEKVLVERGLYSKELMESIAKSGSIQKSELPSDIKKVFVTSHDISPNWHVEMQAAFQKYTDNAVSKTVNLSNDATIKDVKDVYDLAYELSCKGVTVYRDGSKDNQVLTTKKKETLIELGEKITKDRPSVLTGYTTRVLTGMGKLYVTVNEFDGYPFEVFATIGKSGKSTTAKTEAIGRLVSLCLRCGIPVESIIEQLKGIAGEHPIFQEGRLILSIPDAISFVLENKYVKNPTISSTVSLKSNECPECKEELTIEEGCMKCHRCGYNKCG